MTRRLRRAWLAALTMSGRGPFVRSVDAAMADDLPAAASVLERLHRRGLLWETCAVYSAIAFGTGLLEQCPRHGVYHAKIGGTPTADQLAAAQFLAAWCNDDMDMCLDMFLAARDDDRDPALVAGLLSLAVITLKAKATKAGQ